MISRKLFEEELRKIEISFNNFSMTKEKADFWYGVIKDLEDKEWKQKIHNCLIYCHRIPTLADILDLNNYYEDGNEKETKARALACRKRNPGCYQRTTTGVCSYC